MVPTLSLYLRLNQKKLHIMLYHHPYGCTKCAKLSRNAEGLSLFAQNTSIGPINMLYNLKYTFKMNSLNRSCRK